MSNPTPPANAGDEIEPVLQGLPAIQARLRQLANDLWVHGADAVKAGDPDMFLRVADCIGDWAKTQCSLDETRRQRDEALAKLSRIPAASESADRDEKIERLRKSLKWAREYLIEGEGFHLLSDDDEEETLMLKHDCELHSAPDKGGCSICDAWVELDTLLSEPKGGNRE